MKDTGIIHPTAAEHIRNVGQTIESLLADDTTADDLATGGIPDDEIDDLRASLSEARRARCAEFLERDGFDPELAEAVLQAHEAGALLWTRSRLTTTDASRIDARPRR